MDNPFDPGGGFPDPFGGGCDPFVDPGCIGEPPPIGGGGPPVVILVDSGVAAEVGSVVTALVSVGSIVDALKSFLGLLVSLLSGILGLIKSLWDNVLKKAIDAIKKAVDWLHQKLGPILKTIRDWQKAQRALLLKLYNQFIRPIIQVIETIRRIIHLLDLLHIHILDGLDKFLGRLEAKILAPFYKLLYRVNTLGGLFGYTLNSFGLIFRSLYLATLTANRGGAFSILASSPVYGFTELPPAVPAAAGGVVQADNFQTASSAVSSAGPDMQSRFTGTPAQVLVACWEQPIGNVDLSTAIDNMTKCLLA